MPRSLVVALAWADRWLGVLQVLPVRASGLLVISPVLVLAAYTFLRDDELEPYRGRELYIRITTCAAVYLILWAGLAYVKFCLGTPSSGNGWSSPRRWWASAP